MDDSEFQAYYARDLERDRLLRSVGRLEFLRTVEVITRTLPPPPASVADIGGGPGRYTDWLIEAGYTVIHRDVVAHHVDQVRARHADVDAGVGDARSLDVADDIADAVLLLGPLYHLAEPADRLRALAEARRVTRPGGVIHVAAISRWAARLHGMLVERAHLEYPSILELVDDVDRTGVMRAVLPGGFNGYAHTPDELRHEIVEAHLELESLVSVEGIAFALADLDERLDDPTERALVLDTLRAVESVPALLGSGPHLLAIARKPAG